MAKLILTFIFRIVPEGLLRHYLRAAALKLVPEMSKRYYVNRGDVAIEVGMPKPENARLLLDLVGPNGLVIGVEPEAGNFETLKSDQALDVPNIRLMNKGAWSGPGRLTLTVSGSEYDHKIDIPDIEHDNDLPDGAYVGEQTISVDSIDNILEELRVDRVDFIEICVNGAEVEVLKGMTKTLDQPMRIFVKTCARHKDTKSTIQDEVVEILRSHGFRTVRTGHSKAVDAEWGVREGDVYACKL